MKRVHRAALVAVLTAACAVAALATGLGSHNTPAASAAGACQLGNKDGQIKHVIYLQFDNTHFRRDRPNVPSDLEQMPHLLNFLKGERHARHERPHDPDLAHRGRDPRVADRPLPGPQRARRSRTATTTSRPTGRRSSRRRSSTGRTPVDGDERPAAEHGQRRRKTTPAPWVPTPRAGCDVGGVSARRTSSSRTTRPRPAGDMTQRLRHRLARVERGERRPAARADRLRRHRDPLRAGAPALCATTPNAKPDDAARRARRSTTATRRSSAPSTSTRRSPAATACVKATDGDATITDPAGNCGFPGFDGVLAKNTLG